MPRAKNDESKPNISIAIIRMKNLGLTLYIDEIKYFCYTSVFITGNSLLRGALTGTCMRCFQRLVGKGFSNTQLFGRILCTSITLA